MSRVLIVPTLKGALFLGVVCVSCISVFSAERTSVDLIVKSVRGRASYSADHVNWLPLQAEVVLREGAILKTEANSSADVVLKSSGTALRLTPATLLEVMKLEKEMAGEEVITRTSLDLRSGAVIGSQRKLDQPSTFQINTSGGMVAIRGTEYMIRADGSVTCLTGKIGVNYDGIPMSVDVPGGFALDPITRHVAAIQAEFLTALSGDIGAVRDNARSMRADAGTAIARLDKDKQVSPTKGNNGVGNGVDPQPPGNPPVNDGPGTGPGNPGNKGGAHK